MTQERIPGSLNEILENLDGENIEYEHVVEQLMNHGILTQKEKEDILYLKDSEEQKNALFQMLVDKEKGRPVLLKILVAIDQPSSCRVQEDIPAIVDGSQTEQIPRRNIMKSCAVSKDWPLKIFLIDISGHITSKDLEKMKSLVGGESGIGKSLMEKTNTPLRFLEVLQETRKLDRHNLVYLQTILWFIGRKDLHEKVMEFCKESSLQPLYFYAPRDTPENGYKYLKYHLCGELGNVNSHQLEIIRTRLANLLCVPLQFVFISGIEPSESLLLTFMVPEESLTTFMSSGLGKTEYMAFGLHVHNVNEKIITVSDMPENRVTHAIPMHKQLKDLLEREQYLEEELQRSNEQLVYLREELGIKEKMVANKKTENLYRDLFQHALNALRAERESEAQHGANGTKSFTHTDTLARRSALTFFRSLLAKVKENNYDMDLINQLLDSRSVIASMQEQQKYFNLHLIIQTLTGWVMELETENEILKATTFLTGSSGSCIQHMFEASFKRGIQVKQGVSIEMGVIHALHSGLSDFPIVVEPEFQQILMAITDKLTARERNRLRARLRLTDTER